MRRRLWQILEVAAPGDLPSRIFDVFILTLIFLNVVAVILVTVEGFGGPYAHAFFLFEVVSVAIFTLEYLARVYACVEDPRFASPVKGRLRFALSPMALVDLCAILPFYVAFLPVDLRFIRVLRLLRVVRLAKVGRYYSALQLIGNVFRARREELLLTAFVMVLLLVLSASSIYYCENPVQPEAFSSIPQTFWWAVTTLTTVGYGDMYPITPHGKLLASVIAILGIGMFALPTGILGAGFVEEIQKTKRGATKCPHCGGNLAGT